MAKGESHGTEDTRQTTPSHSDLNEQIVNSLTSGVMAIGGHGEILTVNRAAREHLQLLDSQLEPGTLLESLPAMAPFAKILEEVKESGQGISRRSIKLIQDSGLKKELGVTVSLLDGSKAFNGAIFLFINMTEIRRLERAAEVNRQLASIGELTAGVVHEIRNPLTIIRGRAELLLRKFEEGDSSFKSADAILSEAKSLEKLVGQFLGFAKPYSIEKGPCSAENLAERSAALCKRRADNKGVKVTWTCEADMDDMKADAEKMCQAVSNIINNAVDAVGDGGEVFLNIRTDEGHTVIDISDNGPGIHIGPEEDLFSPFFSRKRDGTGLGLSIVHKIVTAHGGSVNYTNREEGGAKFTIVLPQEED